MGELGVYVHVWVNWACTCVGELGTLLSGGIGDLIFCEWVWKLRVGSYQECCSMVLACYSVNEKMSSIPATEFCVQEELTER